MIIFTDIMKAFFSSDALLQVVMGLVISMADHCTIESKFGFYF
jgi:hypothetical protein